MSSVYDQIKKPRKYFAETLANVRGSEYNESMKRKGTENKPYIIAMRELRRSNKAGTHDNRPNRLRTRKNIKQHAIKEYS